MSGKGDARRPSSITPEEWERNYERTFNGRRNTTAKEKERDAINTQRD